MSLFTDFMHSLMLKKLLVCLSGLFLIFFLVGHLMGNLQLLISNEGDVARLQFNAYAHFMTTNPAVKALSYLTYFFFLLHITYALVLTRINAAARPQNYGYTQHKGGKASWASKNMGILGTLIFIFLLVHLRGFWYEMHWGGILLDSKDQKDLYSVVEAAYQQWWYVLIYAVSMIFLGFHLSHGFGSAFSTLGWYHKRYTPLLQVIGIGFSIIVSGLFALIPIIMYLRML